MYTVGLCVIFSFHPFRYLSGLRTKLFVRDLTKFDIYAHVNSSFHVFRQETRKKLCKWNTFWILVE